MFREIVRWLWEATRCEGTNPRMKIVRDRGWKMIGEDERPIDVGSSACEDIFSPTGRGGGGWGGVLSGVGVCPCVGKQLLYSEYEMY